MDRVSYQRWLEAIDDLSEAQRSEVGRILEGRSPEDEVIAALESRLPADRVCPHCQTRGAMCRGRANGLRRFHCAGCGKTFNALTGTALAGLHYKGRWFDFARSLSESETVRKSAKRCAVAVGTAFRWRHRFLRAIQTDRAHLSGIVEADETDVLESRKGSRAWKRAEVGDPGTAAPERKPRRRGGKATKRGLSSEQTPILIATDRSGITVSRILPADNGDSIANVLGPMFSKDASLVTDGAGAFRICAMADDRRGKLTPFGG
jgi:transposase-like protein